MEPGGYVAIGRIVKTHGLKGEVAVEMTRDLPSSLPQGLGVWFVPPPTPVRFAHLSAVRPGPKGALLAFDEVTDIEIASTLVGAEILAQRSQLADEWLGEDGEAFDPLGFEAVDTARGPLGIVSEVIVTGANDVWVIDGPFGEILIPVIDEVVSGIDEDARRIDVTLLPGLLPQDSEEA